MIRMVSILALSCLLASCSHVKEMDAESVRGFPDLSSVRSIYIERFRDDSHVIENVNLLQLKISERLAQSGRFSVVRNSEQADAVLAGMAGVEHWYHGLEGYYGMEGYLDTHTLGIGKLRLVDSKTKQVIWTHEYDRGFLKLFQSVSERVVEQFVNKLVQDATRADSNRMQK